MPNVSREVTTHLKLLGLIFCTPRAGGRQTLNAVLLCVTVGVSHTLSSATQSCPTLWPSGLGPTRLLCPWDFPGKNTEVCCHFLLQGILPIQGPNQHLLCLLHWQADSLRLVLGRAGGITVPLKSHHESISNRELVSPQTVHMSG